MIQRVLFGIMIPCMRPIQANEWGNSLISVLLVLVVGALVSPGLAFFTAFLNENRRRN